MFTPRLKRRFTKMIDDILFEFQTIEEISRKIDEIDELINLQLTEILHHPEFKSLEAAWRGVHYLVNRGELGSRVKVKVLNAEKRALLKDFDRSLSTEDSAIHEKIYTEVYEEGRQSPFGLLVGAYEFGQDPLDVNLLKYMAEVSSAAHAPVVAGVAPAMFGVENFDELERIEGVSGAFDKPNGWNNFRDSIESRSVGLCLPRFLLRPRFKPGKNFKFRETFEKKDLLWGNAAFAFAGCVVRAYSEKSWLGKMRGPGTDGEVGGLAGQEENEKGFGTGLDARLDDKFAELTLAGFMTLIGYKSGSPYFFHSPSVYRSPVNDSPHAAAVGWLHSQLENILAASRFAVYLMSRWLDQPFQLNTLNDKRNFLNKWLDRYCGDETNVSAEEKARRPMREAMADLQKITGQPGVYNCRLFIRPVYLLDEIPIAMRLQFTLKDRH